MRKFALCIGNNNYQYLSPLSYAVADATDVAEKLKSLGFDVILKTDLDRKSLNAAALEFLKKLNIYDAVLLFYAGHGFQVNGNNILAPIDLDLDITIPPEGMELEAFSLGTLMSWLVKYPTKSKVIILDACRQIRGLRGGSNTFAPVLAPQGSIIAFSTSPDQTAGEKDGHGLYTKSLLRYMDLPRVPIETVFKKVRTALANETHGAQISWEHTSMIGEFYLNPDTIYDGVVYSADAYADGKFRCVQGSKIQKIIDNLKVQSWNTQNATLFFINHINFQSASANELFVLGRNIYQAACGNSLGCVDFINDFARKAMPAEAKLHILNGMAFEIYYDHEGKLRRSFKTECLGLVVKLLEQPEFYGSCRFIVSCLQKDDAHIFYMPGQNEKVDVTVELERVEDTDTASRVRVANIIYNGRSIYYERDGNDWVKGGIWDGRKKRSQFESELSEKMAVPEGALNVTYEGADVSEEDIFLLPWHGYSVFPNRSQDSILF